MTIKEFFSFKANKYFWLNLMAMVAVVCLLFFGVLKWLDSYTRHGEAVVVPNVKGMTIDEAEMLFRNHGLVCVVSDSSYVKNKPAGSILACAWRIELLSATSGTGRKGIFNVLIVR